MFEEQNPTPDPPRLVPGSIVYWQVPRVDSQTLGSKLSYQYRGPYIIRSVHRGHTVTIRDLKTGKENRQRVAISQLKLPAFVEINGEIVKNVVAPTSQYRLRPGAKFTPVRPGDNEE